MDRIISNGKERYLTVSAQTLHRLIPQRYPLQLLDAVKACYLDEGRVIGVKQITMTDPVLNGHFPGFPIYPGVLLIEAMAQNAGVIAVLRNLHEQVGSYEAILSALQSENSEHLNFSKILMLAESRIKHIRPVYPGQGVELHAALQLQREGMNVFKVSAWADGVESSRGQMTLADMPADMLGALPTAKAANA